VAVRASKVALARTAELLGSDRDGARSYLRRVQAAVRRPVPFATIVAAIEEVGTDIDAVITALGDAPGE
jgi:hypothetical protein